MSDRQHTTPGNQPAPPGDGGSSAPPPPRPGPDDRPTGPVGSSGAAPAATAPDYSPRPVAVRRPDTLGALLLLFAGLAAGISLLLRWLDGDDSTGLDLVERGFDELGQGIGRVFDTGFWQPMTVVLGGAALFLLAFLLFVPARRHRFVGAVALVTSALMAAAVLIPLWRAGWDLDGFDPGFWFAVAAAVLGLLGSLKAVLTGRRYGRAATP